MFNVGRSKVEVQVFLFRSDLTLAVSGGTHLKQLRGACQIE